MFGLYLALAALLPLAIVGVAWRLSRQYRIRRAVANGDVILAADIDAIRTKPYAFQLFDEIHTIQPFTVEKLVEVTSAVAHLGSMHDRKNSKEDLLAAYGKLFRETCPTLNRSVLEKMNVAQIAQVYNLILEYIAGKAHIEAEKKNLAV